MYERAVGNIGVNPRILERSGHRENHDLLLFGESQGQYFASTSQVQCGVIHHSVVNHPIGFHNEPLLASFGHHLTSKTSTERTELLWCNAALRKLNLPVQLLAKCRIENRFQSFDERWCQTKWQILARKFGVGFALWFHTNGFLLSNYCFFLSQNDLIICVLTVYELEDTTCLK